MLWIRNPILSGLLIMGMKHSAKDKDDIHSRAYITFKSAESLVAFHRAYDGWSFRDKQGGHPSFEPCE